MQNPSSPRLLPKGRPAYGKDAEVRTACLRKERRGRGILVTEETPRQACLRKERRGKDSLLRMIFTASGTTLVVWCIDRDFGRRNMFVQSSGPHPLSPKTRVPCVTCYATMVQCTFNLSYKSITYRQPNASVCFLSPPHTCPPAIVGGECSFCPPVKKRYEKCQETTNTH